MDPFSSTFMRPLHNADGGSPNEQMRHQNSLLTGLANACRVLGLTEGTVYRYGFSESIRGDPAYILGKKDGVTSDSYPGPVMDEQISRQRGGPNGWLLYKEFPKMAIAIPRRQPWYSRAGLLRIAAEVRRLPLIPTSILLLVLIIPAVFAPFIAPADPLKGALSKRLLPPFWTNQQVLNKTVVSEVDPGKFNSQITVGDAQNRIKRGLATPASGVEGEELAIGNELAVTTQEGGTTKHLLGTDKVGRDILSRIIYGSRISLIVAAIAILLSGVIGASLGIMAGYFGGWVDAVIMRLVDISLSIPIILLALVLVAALGPSFETVIAVIVIFMWARYARMARGDTLAVRVQDYIARARVAGASHTRIMIHHVFPNVFNSMVVLATLQVGWVIILESTLSFLGAGIPRPTPAWGLMVADGRELIVASWWVAFFPGLAIMLTCMSINLLGDWLRDRLDPKQRQV